MSLEGCKGCVGKGHLGFMSFFKGVHRGYGQGIFSFYSLQGVWAIRVKGWIWAKDVWVFGPCLSGCSQGIFLGFRGLCKAGMHGQGFQKCWKGPGQAKRRAVRAS